MIDTGEKDDKSKPKMTFELWDANAIEKVDDFTFKMNTKQPQLAVPEHLAGSPIQMLDPDEGGEFGPGSNGTGAYDLVEVLTREKAVLKARGHIGVVSAHMPIRLSSGTWRMTPMPSSELSPPAKSTWCVHSTLHMPIG